MGPRSGSSGISLWDVGFPPYARRIDKRGRRRLDSARAQTGALACGQFGRRGLPPMMLAEIAERIETVGAPTFSTAQPFVVSWMVEKAIFAG